jgi:hypothetical protein
LSISERDEIHSYEYCICPGELQQFGGCFQPRGRGT